jgi:MSHA biogenesis protein MshO
MSTAMKPLHCQRGFTLVELVMVIVIMGVIGGIVSVFMKSPIDAYFASARRAALTDTADTTVRRMTRDIQRALPNSVRTPIASAGRCVEFIPTKTGGRYRIDEKIAADDTSLDFTKPDATFNMLGSNVALPADQRILVGDVIVVYNLGIPDSDAYQIAGSVNRAVVGGSNPLSEAGTPLETTIPIASTQFPLASGSNRFHVVSGAENVVSFVCSGGDLHRTISTFAAAAATSCPATGPILARNVSACNFDYGGSDLQRNALIRMTLQLTDSGETVSLLHEVHVSNTP